MNETLLDRPMSNVTQQLKNEHQNILRVIDHVLAECQRLEKGGDLDVEFFEQIIDFIRNYADKFHHAKEEDILFATMLDNVECMHCNPIPVMLYEHNEGREYVRGMEKALNRNDKHDVIENARDYCYLLQNHIYKEDNVLYPMAEEAIKELQKEIVLQKYIEVETSKFSKEAIYNYENLFNDMKISSAI